MRPFSKKKQRQIEEDIRAAQHEEALFRATHGSSMASPDALTRDEIVSPSKTIRQETSEISPLENLRQKMIDSKADKQTVSATQATDMPVQESGFTPFFSVKTDFFDGHEELMDAHSAEPVQESPSSPSQPTEFAEDQPEPTADHSETPFGDFIDNDIFMTPFYTPFDTVTDDTDITKQANRFVLTGPSDTVAEQPLFPDSKTNPASVSDTVTDEPMVDLSDDETSDGFLFSKKTPSADEPIQLSALDEVYGSYPQEIDPQPDEAEIPYPKSGDQSVLQTCMPFIMDGADDTFSFNARPSYTLDSVEKILGLEEKEPKKESADAASTLVFEPIHENRQPIISDIDPLPEPSDESTELFGVKPVTIMPDGLEVSREINLSPEFFQKKEESKPLPAFDNTQEDTFEPPYEYTDTASVKPVRRKLLTKRRNAFFGLVSGFLALFVALIGLLPSVRATLVLYNAGSSVLLFVSLVFSLLAGLDAFAALPGLIGKRAKADCLFAFSLLLCGITTVMTVAGRASLQAAYTLVFLNATVAFIRGLYGFWHQQTVYHNFRMIVGSKEKYGTVLIDNAPTTFAMAHRAIEGEALVAAARPVSFVDNYMKNTMAKPQLNGKVALWFVLDVIFSLLCGMAVGVYHQNLLGGITAAASLAALFCPPMVFGIQALPLKSANRRLWKEDAMITGARAAEQIEEANALVIDCDKLFPEGSIKLSDLTILSQNNLEKTLAFATAITKTIKSPLYPIFKSAMDTNTTIELPVADSIKYEERLGITGWVGDTRVFIGNRALMLAHEIDVPDAETDKQLLKNGYFPVYLARDGKACARLAVRYDPPQDTAKELRRITGMGVTLLINNCDQNLSEDMICDYFDLYEDSVKIMSGSGVHMYANAVEPADHLSTGAVCHRKLSGLAGIVGCSIRIKRAIALLSVMAVLTAILGVILFLYRFFGTAAPMISGFSLIWYQLIALFISLIAYLFSRP